MQGQRSAIGSLPESLTFEHGSASSDAGVVEPQIYWNSDVQNSSPNRLSDYVSLTDTSDVFLNSTNQDSPNVSMWNMGEGGSSSVPNEASQSQIELRTPHMLSLGDTDTNLACNHASIGHHNFSMTPSFIGFKPSNSSETHRGSSSSSFSDPFGPSSDPFELEGRRLPRKRKALELSGGQSSSGPGSSNSFQRPEDSTSAWLPVAENPPSDPTNPRLGLGVGGVSSSENPIVESAHRNVRLRINTPGLEDPSPDNNNNVQLNVSALYPSLRLNAVESRSPPVATTAENPSNNLGQPVLRVPALRRHLQASSRWNRNSPSRAHRASNIVISGDRNELDSRTLRTNILDHPLFVQQSETRTATQNEVNWSLNSGVGGGMNVSNVGNNVASSSRAGSSSGPTPSSAAAHRSSPHYPPRRLSEFLRRSLLSSTDSAAGGGRNRNIFPRIPPPMGASASYSQDTGIPPIHGHLHLPHSRSLGLMDRHLDGAFGFPYLSQTAAGSEGRGRLVSEIRNVLDLMRRGEALRFEDLMILDQSIFHGVADIHDRHRDMRLDIDNMSYEELLALEERIGDVNTGLPEETILNRLKQKKYSTITAQPDAEPCCICQEEYDDGNDMGALDCGHEFHTSCIKQWLVHKNMCPICKSTAFDTK